MPDTEPPGPTLDVDDRARLEALERYGVLDSGPDAAFDDIVSVAAKACGTPFGLVSLVAAERQWFKAKVGIEARETPIEQSVCAHALGETELLIIPDLTKDPRTSANTLVTGEPHLRFYAGAVLKTPDGHALGSLCVIDVEPRPEGLTESQRDILVILARQTMALLEMRKAVIVGVDDLAEQSREQQRKDAAAAAVASQEIKLRLAIHAARMGIFDYDLVSGELMWDARVRELFGASSAGPVTYEGSFLKGVHPDDREAADRAVQEALDPAGPGVFDTEYRTVAPDGRVRWLAARGQTVVEAGRVTRFVGAVRDVTARRELDDRIAATLERYKLVGRVTKDVIWDWDLVTNHVVWNDALTPAYGYRPDEIAPTPEWWLDHVHPDDRERVRQDIYRVIDGSEIDWSHEYRFLRVDGSWADVFDRGSMIRGPRGEPLRMIGAMFDDTARKAEEDRQRLLNNELSHRMKNILAMVQAIAGQTLRTAETMEDAQKVLSGRLVALGKAHDILLGGRTDGARLSAIVEEAVRMHLDAPERVRSSGPGLEIGSKAALPIVLMLHELATNASKYGALSNGAGFVDVSWAVEGRGGEEVLKFFWIESGGPTVAVPGRKGFGTRLIERGLAGQLGASVRMDYPPTGLICTLEAPLARLRETD